MKGSPRDAQPPRTSAPSLFRSLLRDESTILAPLRAQRPNASPGQGDDPEQCPFCPGHEAETPPEVLALRHVDSAANSPDWTVRVVPNRYPIVELPPPDPLPEGEGADGRPPLAVGRHEVVIETPEHRPGYAPPSGPDEVRQVLDATARRMRSWWSDPRILYTLAFRNAGQRAGASIEHPHSQLLGLGWVPEQVRRKLARARLYWEEQRRSVFGDLIRLVLEKEPERLVYQNPEMVVYCPQDARVPLEMTLVPRHRGAHFPAASTDAREALADALFRSLLALHRVLGTETAYNLILQTAPITTDPTGPQEEEKEEAAGEEKGDSGGATDTPEGGTVPCAAFYRWHLEIIPRETAIAGFELATGSMINVEPPAASAARLRAGL